MRLKNLGTTDIKVSEICLGTMTWGQQNSEEEAHSQLDFSLDNGINFIDTAEMYPVPPMKETCHKTEEYIGSWINKNKTNREKIVIATKVAGRTSSVASGPPGLDWIRGGPILNKKHINDALKASLSRLNTDYIDLYQIHWPERIVNNFGSLGYTHSPRADDTPIIETLEALATHVEAGRIKYIGLSNETPWGVMHFLELAKNYNLPRIVSIQNPYNLLNRSFEIGLSEISFREHVGLLAYSPLAFGVLSGKYLDGKIPTEARLTLFERFKRYTGEQADSATKNYIEIALNYNLDPAQMALAFVNMQGFLTSNIIGATTLEQLKSNINSVTVTLSESVLSDINKVHKKYTFPCP